MELTRGFAIVSSALICLASVVAQATPAPSAQGEILPSLPLQQRLVSPTAGPGENWLRTTPTKPAEAECPNAPESKSSRVPDGGLGGLEQPGVLPLRWGGDVLVSAYDDVVRNAEFDFDVVDGTLYAYLWRDWGVYPEHRFYMSTTGGQSWDWRTGSTYEPLTFTDSDFVYCDSIAIAVCAFKHDTAYTINADRFNMKNLAWDPGYNVFYSTTAGDSVYSLALATDYDNYLRNPYVYLVAHIANKIHFWRSLDKGKTWVDHAILATGDVSYPDVAYSWLSGGKVYVSYFKDQSVFLARNPSFGSSTAWAAPWQEWNILQTGKMTVVAAARDTVQVMFESTFPTFGTDQIEARVTMDGGTTWAGVLLTANSAIHLYPDATARGGVFRIAYLEFDGGERRVMYRRCRKASIIQWDSPIAVNDHFPYWDYKPFGNPCVEGMPGDAAGIMYTGFYENREAWFDYEANIPAGVTSDLPVSGRLRPFESPTRGTVSLTFDLDWDQETALEIYDVSGRLVAQLACGPTKAGLHSVTWNMAECADGIYFVTLTTDAGKESRKLVLLR
jgi:hypothetical protein